MKKDLTKMTKKELLALLEKQREYQRKYLRRPEVKARMREYLLEYRRKPEVKAKRQEYQREYSRKLAAGYAAAKKAGLI